MIHWLYKGAKQLSLTTMRAAAFESAPESLTKRAARTRGFLAFATENLNMTICGIGL
ncbi:hypothetical protein CES85_3912 [Ochrobactrum quorumnocens]|uniref:Uncharacterized protein n=1 Tax=Ochrobactrum quorumnocens TaxID=271865 RepID=A0A248U8Z4_9HYPH|nr:hypothetical protein CES85_3912 [[Ochrobactrum] quorumnocens]